MNDITNEDGSVEIAFDDYFLKYNFDNFNKKYFSSKLKEIPLHWWSKEHSVFQYSIKPKEVLPNNIFISNNVKSLVDLVIRKREKNPKEFYDSLYGLGFVNHYGDFIYSFF